MILLVLLGVFGGVVWYTGQTPSGQDKEQEKKTPVVLKFNADEARTVEFEKSGQKVGLRRDAGEPWRLVVPEEAPADQARVEAEVMGLAGLRATRVIEENPSDLAPFGLAQPAILVRVRLGDGRQLQLAAGKESPGGGGRYAKLLDRPAVYLISSFQVSDWEQMVARPPKAAPTPTAVPATTPAASPGQ